MKVELQKKLIISWRDLKNEKLDDDKRKAAYADIIHFSDEISKVDPKFRMNVEMLETYKKFKSGKIVPRVVWPKFENIDNPEEHIMENIEKKFDQITNLAVHITKKRLPREPQDSQLFGMVVSATSGHLITLIDKHL